MAGSSLREQKSLLRKAVGKEIALLNEEEMASQSTSITKKVLSLGQYKRARSISIFLSMPGKEISTTELVLDALRGGKNVFVPYIHSEKKSASKSMAMLRIQDDEDLSSLEPDPWGIPSLSQDSVSSRQNALGGYGISDGDRETQDPQLDLIFMPAVAFDRSRHRLGHGKGFYDRYLQRYQNAARASGSPMPLLVGLALRPQLLPSLDTVPHNEDDWQVDMVLGPDPST